MRSAIDRPAGALDRLVILFLLGIFICFPAAAELRNGPDAELVVGQTDFFVSSPGVGNVRLNNPSAIYVTRNRLFVADFNNNRVLIWNQVPTSSGAPADLVLGQPDFNSSGPGLSATSFFEPVSIASDGRRLLLAEASNHRILIWNNIPASSFAPADVVIGQPDFTSDTANNGGIGATTLNLPTRIHSDGKRLFVTDEFNNRVLIYNSIPTSNFAPADLVIGQPDFVSSAANQGSSRSDRTLSNPRGIWSDGRRMLISDRGNRRVLVYRNLPRDNGAPADAVIGQGNFQESQTSSPERNLSTPVHVFSDGRRIFVTDREGANRILVWNEFPEINGQQADYVIGQPDFLSRSSGNSKSKLNLPNASFYDGKTLFVADLSNNRVLLFHLINAGVSLRQNPQFTQGKALLGKVFSDPNENGAQDEGEKGLEGVKVVSDTGIYAITDSEGKYHFPYIETGQRILKLDPGTLPEGARITTESPRKTVVTEGVLTKISFGVKTSDNALEAPKTGPLLKATITQDPALLKPWLNASAVRKDGKIRFEMETNYAAFVRSAKILIYDDKLRKLDEIELTGAPYAYETEDRASWSRYQVILVDADGRSDTTSLTSIL